MRQPLHFAPEACQEISRGLSERERAQPPVVETENSGTLERMRGILDTPSGCGSWVVDVFQGYAKTRTPG